jgi:hypothetical protein
MIKRICSNAALGSVLHAKHPAEPLAVWQTHEVQQLPISLLMFLTAVAAGVCSSLKNC